MCKTVVRSALPFSSSSFFFLCVLHGIPAIVIFGKILLYFSLYMYL